MEVMVDIDKEKVNLILKKYCKKIISDLRTFAIEKAIENESVNTGFLIKSSYLGEITEMGFGDVEGVLTFDAPYAACVEFGTYPGYYPPYSKIYKWVTKKLGIKKQKDARKVTFAIIQSIHEKGTMPHPFFRPAIEKIKQKYSEK